MNDEQLFGLGASTGHNDNESASDSENDDEEDDQESEENNSGEKSKSAKKRHADEAGDTDAKKTKQAWFLLASWKKILFCDKKN